MKVLIVDDERHVREAVKMLVDWPAFGIGEIVEADNGDEAIRLIGEKRPDIVITDMKMPVRDGCDLLRWIQESGHPVRRIVISGHDDFDLVRSTMKYGGQDYLLKPIDQEELAEALRKAVDELRREERDRLLSCKRGMELNRFKPAYWDRMFSSLVSEPGAYAAASDMLKEEFGLKAGDRCQVVVVSALSAAPAVLEKYERNRDLLFFSLANVCNEFLRPDNLGFACRHWSSEDELLIFYWNRFAELQGLLVRINDGLELALGSRFDFGIGPAADFPQGAGDSYAAARAALRQRNLLERRTRYFGPGEPPKPAVAAPQATDYEERFRIALLSRSEAEIRAAVADWMRAVACLPVITPEQLDLWRMQFQAMQSRWARDLPGGGREGGTLGREPEEAASSGPYRDPAHGAAPFTFPLDAEGRLSLSLWEQELNARLAALAAAWGGERQKDNNMMREIARYIEQNYNRELTLQEIAGQFHLSREYISRRFKQEFGENLSDFLERIRIGKAKRLLRNPALRIAEVANMVGYADEKYFSKVFKKLEGQSPNRYRKG
jgi:two-component system response regulator YesN